MVQAGGVFPAQVTTENFLVALFYILGTVGTVFYLLALILLDASTVSRKNLIDTIAQKTISIMIGFVAFLPVGFGIWNVQFYEAQGAPHPIWNALSDWALWGPNLTQVAQRLDPALVPGADGQQALLVYFGMFAATVAAFIHGAGLERMKPAASFVLAAIASGLVMPVAAYLAFGPVGPMSNAGVHDFVGIFPLYILVGCWALIIAVRLGPRAPAPRTVDVRFYVIGLFLLLIGVPLVAVSGGYIAVGQGYYGITLSESGLGLVFVSLFAAFAAGGITGGLIAYYAKSPVYALLGPLSGYVSCSGLLDVVSPWKVFLVASVAPLITYGCGRLLYRLRIDEPKIAATTLGPAIYGALMTGIVAHGVPTGGTLGVTTGPYALRHAHISFVTQTLGVVVIAGISLASALLAVFLVEKTIGLRVTPEAEEVGLDRTYWPNFDGANEE